MCTFDILDIMSTKKSHALVLGASGLVGLHTTKMLLQQNTYDIIYAVSRRGIPFEHERLIQIHADYDTIESKLKDIPIYHIFSCLGSTAKKTPDKENYFKIDYEYPMKVARLALKNGATKFTLVSAIGANANSGNFYVGMKGKLEESIIKLNFDETHIMRPALITGERPDSRPTELFATWLFKVLNPLLIGGLKKFRSIPGKTIAQALVNTAKVNQQGVYTYNTAQIKELA